MFNIKYFICDPVSVTKKKFRPSQAKIKYQCCLILKFLLLIYQIQILLKQRSAGSGSKRQYVAGSGYLDPVDHLFIIFFLLIVKQTKNSDKISSP